MRDNYSSERSMDIKLISPRMSLRPMDSAYKRVMSPSISLMVIAALARVNHGTCGDCQVQIRAKVVTLQGRKTKDRF